MDRKLNGIDYVEEMQIGDKHLGYFTKIIPTTIMTVHIDQSIMEPSYYRHVVQGIEELDEGDQLEFHISSQGGRLDGLESVLSAIKNSMATSVAIINSECHSAASILALNCDAICVSPYASMLIHFVSFGSTGASNHVLKHAGHIKKTSERLFRDTYKYFLTEEEITRCIEDDYQLWLDSEEIQERLERKNKLLLAEQNSQESSEDPNEGYIVPPLEYNPEDVAFNGKEYYVVAEVFDSDKVDIISLPDSFDSSVIIYDDCKEDENKAGVGTIKLFKLIEVVPDVA